MRTIGINFQAIKGLSDEDYVQQMQELGFGATFTQTYDDPHRHEALAELFAKNGIVYETLHSPFKRINDMWLPGEDGEVMLQELMTCIDHCVISGAGIAVVHLSSGMTPPPVTDLGRARFTALVEYAQKKGIIVAFENQRFLSNIAWTFETFSKEDSVGFCWDCGHEACFAGGREYMPLFGDRLVCTHIHDNMGKLDEDNHSIPFDGCIDYRRFADHLRKVGYTGSLMLEIGCGADRPVGIEPTAYLRKAADAVKKLRDMVDAENV